MSTHSQTIKNTRLKSTHPYPTNAMSTYSKKASTCTEYISFDEYLSTSTQECYEYLYLLNEYLRDESRIDRVLIPFKRRVLSPNI